MSTGERPRPQPLSEFSPRAAAAAARDQVVPTAQVYGRCCVVVVGALSSSRLWFWEITRIRTDDKIRGTVINQPHLGEASPPEETPVPYAPSHLWFAMYGSGVVRRSVRRIARRLAFAVAVCTVLSLPYGSNGEVPPRPTAAVPVLPPVKPADGPQAYPDAEKANMPVFTMDYPRIQIPFEITLWVLLASFAKIGR